MVSEMFYLCLAVATCISMAEARVSLHPISDTQSPDDDNATKLPLHEKWFSQKLDHFNMPDNRYWAQRYYVQNSHYKQNGPVFLFIGGEGALKPSFLLYTAWIDHLKEFNGIGFAVEHRYYGQSRPTPDLSTDNLKYLTVEQALKDLASFVVSTRREYNLTNSKWITFGGSYAGSLAAYMRYKFPHLITGAVADSAVINYPQFLGEAIVTLGQELQMVPGCYESLSKGIQFILDLLKYRQGWTILEFSMNACDADMSDQLDKEALLTHFIIPVLSTVQFSDNARDLSVPNIYSMCTQLIKNDSYNIPFVNLLAFISKVTGRLYKQFPNASCENLTYAAAIEKSKAVDYKAFESVDVSDDRRWAYQVCTQIPFFIETEAPNQPFGKSLSKQYDLTFCKDLFGATNTTIERGRQEMFMNYGGLSMEASNVVYTQGSLDPYRIYGFSSDPNPGSYAIVIQGVGHVANLYGSRYDSPARRDNLSLQHARMRVKQLIGRWISSSSGPGIIG